MKRFPLNMKIGALAALMALGMACADMASAAEKQVNVWCAKTNTGNYFPLVRVSMMVVPDGSNTFEIVLKDGQGEANVSSISFEKHKEMLDLDKYKVESDGSPYIDLSKKCYMFTNTGLFFSLGADKPKLDVKDGSNLFNVTDRNGNVLATDVETVKFMRTNDPSDIKSATVEEEEKLKLLTPISSQMQISGCGDAKVARVFSMSGQVVAQSEVESGVTTLEVSHLNAGIYIVKVGKKSLQFIKK